MPREPKILTPNDNYAVVYEGRHMIIRRGVTFVRAGHPITIGREHMFEPMRLDYEVEQATAAPGEKRAVKLPAPEPVRASRPTSDSDGDAEQDD